MRAVFLVLVLILGAITTVQAKIPETAQRHKMQLIREARQVWGLNAPVSTFAAQIHQESRWRADARSPVGAQGLTQFMPQTASWIAGAYPSTLGANEPYNPVWAMRALVTYNKWLWDRVKVPNDCERMAMVLSSYNGGLGWIARDQKLAQSKGLDKLKWFDNVERVNSGRNAAAFKENRGYPRVILMTFEPEYIQNGWGLGSCNEST